MIKEILRMPIAIPRGIERMLPAGAPSVANILEDITSRVPDIGGAPMPALPGAVTEFVQSIEANLPAGAPKFAPTAREVAANLPGGSSYRPITTNGGGLHMNRGGYRPMS